jgi:hypothetical protein
MNKANMNERIVGYSILFDCIADMPLLIGSLVSRSLWMNFPTDKNTLTIDSQFMMGDAVLISPVIQQGLDYVDAYFPQGMWYDFKESQFAYNVSSAEGIWNRLETPLTSVNVHIAGGKITPLQQSAVTTTESRVTPFTLYVTLCSCGRAVGSLYWDDGESISEAEYLYVDYSAQVASDGSGEIVGTVAVSSYEGARERRVESVVVLWSPEMIAQPTSITLDGAVQPLQSVQLAQDKGRLTFTDLDIVLTENFKLSWTTK